jgi:molecular chaperone GrpE
MTKDKNTEEPEIIEEATEQTEEVQAEVVDERDAKIEELTNDLQRTRADFENYRRQVELQRGQYGELMAEATVKKFLPLLDDIDRAVAAQPEVMAPLAKNIEKTLKSLNLEKLSPEAGEEFNPDLHNAVMVEGDGDTETIAKVLQAGYKYDGAVIRTAMVKVAKN